MAAALVKLDSADGLFDSGVLIEKDSVYPPQWRDTGSTSHRDPIFRFCFLLQLVLPIVLALLVIYTG